MKDKCASIYIFLPIISIYFFFINGNVWGVNVDIVAAYLFIFKIYKNKE